MGEVKQNTQQGAILKFESTSNVNPMLPIFRALTPRDLREGLGLMRYPHDPEARARLLSGPVSVTPNEFGWLLKIDRLEKTRQELERMEKHYRKVILLNADEVARRRQENPEDPGNLPYSHCLVDGADPRLEIAKRILARIPTALRHLESGQQAVELAEIFQLNGRANEMLLRPHVRRSLDCLKAASEGGRRKNAAAKDRRQEVAQQFLEEKRADSSLTQEQFLQRFYPLICVRTLRRGLQDLRMI